MAAPAEQLQFVWHAARYIALRSKTAMPATADDDSAPADSASSTAATAAAAELIKLQELRESILQQLPAEQRGHFSITLDDVQAAAAAAAGGEACAASVSAISWQSVADALEVSALLTFCCLVCVWWLAKGAACSYICLMFVHSQPTWANPHHHSNNYSVYLQQ
jgi:hypothetical protein